MGLLLGQNLAAPGSSHGNPRTGREEEKEEKRRGREEEKEGRKANSAEEEKLFTGTMGLIYDVRCKDLNLSFRSPLSDV